MHLRSKMHLTGLRDTVCTLFKLNMMYLGMIRIFLWRNNTSGRESKRSLGLHVHHRPVCRDLFTGTTAFVTPPLPQPQSLHVTFSSGLDVAMPPNKEFFWSHQRRRGLLWSGWWCRRWRFWRPTQPVPKGEEAYFRSVVTRSSSLKSIRYGCWLGMFVIVMTMQ